MSKTSLYSLDFLHDFYRDHVHHLWQGLHSDLRSVVGRSRLGKPQRMDDVRCLTGRRGQQNLIYEALRGWCDFFLP